MQSVAYTGNVKIKSQRADKDAVPQYQNAIDEVKTVQAKEGIIIERGWLWYPWVFVCNVIWYLTVPVYRYVAGYFATDSKQKAKH